ncbi:undecaprenyl-diphosphate phosphatase [Pontibacter sp. JAM-7]|uniref:undecaprenyl-diphosphate phosphatase n=1 Tax=Pontibacter sp. JAM-7 TaxID=3366581 RepID=UPI003AF49148
MDFLHLVILALLQGLTEFLPISSSAHLILPSQLLGWADQGLAFDVGVHVGTLLAVMVYFRTDLVQLLVAWCRGLTGQSSAESRLAWWIIIATLPAVLAGVTFNHLIETELRSILVIAATTLIFGALLGVADWCRTERRAMEQLTLKDACIIGLAQAVALIPGTSRSGITITAGLLLGLKRQAAARFSFLLSVPVILGAGLLKTLDLVQAPEPQWSAVLMGTVIAGLSAYACIHLFLSWLDRIGMQPFVIYRMVLGMVLLVVWMGMAA